MKEKIKELHVTKEEFESVFDSDTLNINSYELNWFLVENPEAKYLGSEDSFIKNESCEDHEECYTYTIKISYE